MDAHLLPRARTRPAVALAALLMASALPTRAADAGRYALAASATLHPSASVQKNDRFRLDAALAAATATGTAASSGSGYSLAAQVAAVALVCTPDTIFMDGFDGG